MCFSKHNNSKIVKSSVINVVLKMFGMVLNLIYVPLLLSYLGNERYGVWITILSVISWINYCDIGIGNGLRNILAKKLTNEQIKDAKKAVSTSYVCITLIVGIILLSLVLVTFCIDWKTVFNIKIAVEAPLLISFIFICINFILAICNIILYTLQKSEIVSLQSVIIQIINIVGILIISKISDGSLLYISILFGISTFIVRVFTSIRLYKIYPELSPSIKYYDRTYKKEISDLGMKFFVAQIAALVVYTTDNLLVSNMFGAGEVTSFSLVDKVFNTGYMLFSSITVPFWSKTTEEIEKKKYDVVKSYFHILNYLAIVFGTGCIIVAYFFKHIIRIWLQQDMSFSSVLIAVMCVYYVIYAFCGVSSPLINGMGGVNGIMMLGIIQGVSNIPLSIFFAKNMKMGVIGIRLGTLVVVAVGAIFQYIYFYYLIHKFEKI